MSRSPAAASRCSSEFMIADDLAAGRLVRVLPEWHTRVTEVHAVYPARQNLPPRLTLFLDHLAKALNPPPWERGSDDHARRRRATGPTSTCCRSASRSCSRSSSSSSADWIARAMLRALDRVMERSKIDISLRKFLGDVVYAVLFVVRRDRGARHGRRSRPRRSSRCSAPPASRSASRCRARCRTSRPA